VIRMFALSFLSLKIRENLEHALPHHSPLSSFSPSMVGRRTQRSTIGDRAFAAVASAVWNSLPEDVRASTTLQLFRRRLKSELFRRSLGPRHST